MSQGNLSPRFSCLLAGVATTIGVLLMTGCGIGEPSTGAYVPEGGGTALTGAVHGGVTPIIGATVTLYFTAGTGSTGYGAGATAVQSATTVSPNGTFTLGNPSSACPSGGYAYLGSYGGNTGAGTNNNILMMVPLGACSGLYASSSPYAYTGGSVDIDEITTAISAYALGSFMTLSNSGISGGTTYGACTGGATCQINIGAPANNTTTASASTPSAAGLKNAFANALALMNITTGQANTYMNSANSGGVIPTAEINLLGNILQACVNSAGVTGTNTRTSNDGTACGQLFSFTALPSGVSASGPVVSVPSNTLQATLNLAKFPNTSVNNTSLWSTGTSGSPANCTQTGSAAGYTNSTMTCLFGLAASSSAPYTNALSAAPPDWALSVVYTNGYGSNSASTPNSSCATTTCLGLTYPYYVALDYMDNVYVLNWNGSSPTGVNIIGFNNNGTPQFSSPEYTLPSSTLVSTIGLDTAFHVFAFDDPTTSGNTSSMVQWNAIGSSGTGGGGSITLTLVTTGTGNTSQGANTSLAVADPVDNIVAINTNSGGGTNARKFVYNSSGNYNVTALTTTAPTQPVEQLVYGTNLDLYAITGPEASGSVNVLQLANTGTYTKGTAAAANYGSSSVVFTAHAISGSTSTPSYGIGGTSAGNAIAFTYGGNSTGDAIVLTKTSATAMTVGSTISIPLDPSASSVVSRGVFVDGLDYAYSPDGAGGTVPSGVSVFDSTDNSGNGIALGTYRGCLVSGTTCSTSATAGAPTAAPMISPRGAAIDSSGDVWVVSGNSESLTELIGVAAPAWPGLSLGLRGEPQ